MMVSAIQWGPNEEYNEAIRIAKATKSLNMRLSKMSPKARKIYDVLLHEEDSMSDGYEYYGVDLIKLSKKLAGL
jgi:hypothetical protein